MQDPAHGSAGDEEHLRIALALALAEGCPASVSVRDHVAAFRAELTRRRGAATRSAAPCDGGTEARIWRQRAQELQADVQRLEGEVLSHQCEITRLAAEQAASRDEAPAPLSKPKGKRKRGQAAAADPAGHPQQPRPDASAAPALCRQPLETLASAQTLWRLLSTSTEPPPRSAVVRAVQGAASRVVAAIRESVLKEPTRAALRAGQGILEWCAEIVDEIEGILEGQAKADFRLGFDGEVADLVATLVGALHPMSRGAYAGLASGGPTPPPPPPPRSAVIGFLASTALPRPLVALAAARALRALLARRRTATESAEDGTSDGASRYIDLVASQDAARFLLRVIQDSGTADPHPASQSCATQGLTAVAWKAEVGAALSQAWYADGKALGEALEREVLCVLETLWVTADLSSDSWAPVFLGIGP